MTVRNGAPAVDLFGVVAETTAVQTIASMAVLLVPAIAPEIARVLGVPASMIGYQIGALYVAAMGSSLVAGGLVRRYGACRTSQISMACTALGCIAITVPHLGTLLVGSLAIGAGYGLPNPSAAHLLVRHAPERRRNLIFSIKQTGVPLGGMAAGLLGPFLAVSYGWQSGLIACAAAAAGLCLVAQRVRDRWDVDRAPGSPVLRMPLEGLRAVAGSRRLSLLAGASLCFSAIQLSVMSFMVVLLVEEVGIGLLAAGSILAASQVAGVLGRILWGAVADRTGDASLVLILLAAIMAGACAMVVTIGPAWPISLVTAIFAILGLTAAGWNGVFLAEVAKRSHFAQIGATTGAVMFFTFLGVVVGPPTLSFAHDAFGGYAAGFIALAVAALLGGALAFMARRCP
ncbi:MFS transporter (plasmid) [Skermanella sp. TT6]|uniref:MFS transporter n=1 Tax=Skermanella cutis TaxID=2775420 RepID=A0ABX7BFU4_9PROT|nr:MFS transporter [Skermanella sp. TT6]QQP93265.1 MFS transporter [Skermanella sp. TT6]